MKLAFFAGLALPDLLLGLLLHGWLGRRKVTKYFKEGYHMTYEAKKLISRFERWVLRKAAQILLKSDVHDTFFFNQVAACAGDPNQNVLKIGSDYTLVHTTTTATKPLVHVQEV